MALLRKPKNGTASKTVSPKSTIEHKHYGHGWFKKILLILSLLFLIIWIVIGIFLLLVLFQGIRQGAYSGLFNLRQPAAQQNDTTQQETPEDADIPGVGKVNVQCTREALSQQSLQKMLEAKSTDVLTEEEKTKFEACIVEEDTSTPEPSPSATP